MRLLIRCQYTVGPPKGLKLSLEQVAVTPLDLTLLLAGCLISQLAVPHHLQLPFQCLDLIVGRHLYPIISVHRQHRIQRANTPVALRQDHCLDPITIHRPYNRPNVVKS